MRPDTITMTMRQLDRLKVLQALADGHLKTGIAAARLGLSARQTLRLLRRYQVKVQRACRTAAKVLRATASCQPGWNPVSAV